LEQKIYFEDISPGTSLPKQEFGPHTLINGVQWAGIQEHPSPTHTDRDHVRVHRGLRTFICSGAQREAYLFRMLLDWVGPGGDLRKASLRNTASTFEGDMMCYTGTVVEKSPSADDPWVICEIDAQNQNGEAIITGQITLTVPSRRQARQQATARP
jgi:acyl dehydratase